jgi:hypothetical protein
MIRSLVDAWRWYEAMKNLTVMMDRIARRYWNEDVQEQTLAQTLHQDAMLKEYAAAPILELTQRVKDDLDDLAVLLLFSVFEAIVRERTLEEMDRELPTPPSHPTLTRAIADAKDAVEHGSFGRVTEAYKSLNPDVKTQVDQVRQDRNWVAHGHRGAPKNNVDPARASDRLGFFLRLLDAEANTRVSLGPTATVVENLDS